MGDVIQTDKFSNSRARAIYEELLGKLKAGRHEIERNPWPALNAAGDEITRLRSTLDAAYRAVSPSPVWVEGGSRAEPLNIGAEAVARTSLAQKILGDALFRTPRESVQNETPVDVGTWAISTEKPSVVDSDTGWQPAPDNG